MRKLKIILLVFCLYIALVSSIQRFRNPELSETKLFLLIPNNLILNFK